MHNGGPCPCTERFARRGKRRHLSGAGPHPTARRWPLFSIVSVIQEGTSPDPAQACPPRVRPTKGADGLFRIVWIEQRTVIMARNVAILGGGVAGLSAAHELAERGFDVDVYDRLGVFGGKARSIDVPDSAVGDRLPLPGEHGFRFFPSFYRNTFDTLRRIPYGTNDQGVYDNLAATREVLAGQDDGRGVVVPIEMPPGGLSDWEALYRLLVQNDANIPPEEFLFFARRIWTFLTSCEQRRNQEYDHISWWDFIRAEDKTEAYQNFLAVGLTRDLVAMRAEESSTRTVAKIYWQLVQGILAPWEDVNRILDGPTTEVWLDPWVNYLQQLGVKFHPHTEVQSIDFDGDRVTGVDVDLDGSNWTVQADHYIFALPVEVMANLVDEKIAEAAPSLATLDELEVGWMIGLQYFFADDVVVNEGHKLLVDSPWALTSIFEHQFWDDIDLSKYGDGRVESFLSVIISEWENPGELINKTARDCDEDELKQEVWHQLTTRLSDQQRQKLEDAELIESFLSPTIDLKSNPTVNHEPLLVNTVGSLAHRPRASTNIPNMFLASDYVRTHADLATMESANEAARRAVNAILGQLPGHHRPCRVYPLREPSFLEPLKAYDRMRFQKGLPHHELGDEFE